MCSSESLNCEHIMMKLDMEEVEEKPPPVPLITWAEGLERRKAKTVQFNGLSKEELLQYANDPFWRRIRLILFSSFWAVWALALIIAISIFATAPRCPPVPRLFWWQKEAIYHIETKSFYDSNYDGYGDFLGIIAKLPYLREMGFYTIKLSHSLFWSEARSINYGVINFTHIDPSVGNLTTFDTLVYEAHRKGMHVILDYPVFSTSAEHSWYKAAAYERHREHETYKNSYLFKDDPVYVMNMWSGSVNSSTPYGATFTDRQFDLDLRDPLVRNGILENIHYWIKDRNVDGFNFYAYYDFDQLAKNPLAKAALELFVDIRALLDKIGKATLRPKLLMITLMRPFSAAHIFYKYQDKDVAHFISPNVFLNGMYNLTSKSIASNMQKWIFMSPANKWLGWQISGQLQRRASNPEHSVKFFYPFNFLIGGTPIFYYGDEIPLRNLEESAFSNYTGPSWCFQSLAPMQWSNDQNAGFSGAGKTWLPVAKDFQTFNIKRLNASGSTKTSLATIRELLNLRSEPSILHGKTKIFDNEGSVVYWLQEELGYPGFLTLMNMGKTDAHVTLRTTVGVPDTLTVAYSSVPNFAINSTVNAYNILLPKSGILVLRWEAVKLK